MAFPTPTASGTATANTIINCTQSISSGVTNLLVELARVNVSAETAVSNHAIMAQLLALHTLVEGISTRLAPVEESLQKRDSDIPESVEIEPKHSPFDPKFTVDEYNAYARIYNANLRDGNESLVPLRTARNTLLVGFPSTLGHLVFIDRKVDAILRKGFDLPARQPDALRESDDELWSFIGADQDRRDMWHYYSTGDSLATFRIYQQIKRAEEVAAAGASTAKTRKAAMAHNQIARATNALSIDALMPIHDDRNIPVYGWPKDLAMLVKMFRWEIRDLLKEYGQSVVNEGCMDRLVKYVGANEAEVTEWRGEGGHFGENNPCWEM